MPASGKTTAALRLSEKLGIAMLSKDEIKEKLFDRIGFQSRQEKVQLGLAAMEILYYASNIRKRRRFCLGSSTARSQNSL